MIEATTNMGSEFDFPIVEALPPGYSAEQAFLRLAKMPHCLFLDSSLRASDLGRYSFIAVDPYELLVWTTHDDRGVERLSDRLRPLESQPRHDLPPFQGGAAGVFNYEFGHQFEQLPRVSIDEFQLPQATVGLYDLVVAFDHRAQCSWIISQGFPETDPSRRRQRALSRLSELKRVLESPPPNWDHFVPVSERVEIESPHDLVHRELEVYSNFTQATFRQMVGDAIRGIRNGDIFQVNVSQRLLHLASESAVRLYLKLRLRTPATFAGYFDAGDWQIVSASPERFLKVQNRDVEARPIKGTRRQWRSGEADLYAADELQANEKDRAENIMIVDLMRNDLSRVCEDDSIYVSQLCGLESYGYVSHLVSAIRGRLRSSVHPIELLAASFPGGSVTGAPKVRAMELIAELEQVARGPYCGCLGYLGWNGVMDMNILIRTMTVANGWWQLPVGGAVVAQSNPKAEYDETWSKASGMLAAIDRNAPR